MVKRWRKFALFGVAAAMWVGCGESQRSVTKPEGMAGMPVAGSAGAGGRGNASGGGSAAESGEGALAGDGGSAAAPSSGGTPAGAGRSTSGGAPAAGGAGSGTGNTGGVSTNGGNGGGSAAVPSAWNCSHDEYGDGQCHCGCGISDPDCSSGDLGDCEVCNATGSCNHTACPGKIDPEDTTKCSPPPEGWTCSSAAYADGTCDCGCGIVDEDCKDNALTSCQKCDAAGSCANGSCPSAIATDDATRCEYPKLWLCDHEFYGDDTCDCGCAALDIDCADQSASSCERAPIGSCAGFNLFDRLSPSDNAICSVPPTGWQCDALLYASEGECNCGCGAFDPDCSSFGNEACDVCDDTGSCSVRGCGETNTIDPDVNWQCKAPPSPPGWECFDGAYGDGVCECGCGIPDLDCLTDDASECFWCTLCSGDPCPEHIDPADTTRCKPGFELTEDWTCDDLRYFDGECDCGCGIHDNGCSNDKRTDCTNFPEEGCSGGDSQLIDADHNERCTP
jgi:hypothetical protein